MLMLSIMMDVATQCELTYIVIIMTISVPVG